MDKIEIALNRVRLLWAIIGSLCFVAVSFCLVFYANTFVPMMIPLPKPILIYLIVAIGCLGMITFSLFTFMALKTLFIKQNSLIIDEKGITQRDFGLVEWRDITGLKTQVISSNKIILIYISNPQKYIQRLGRLSAFLAKVSLRFYQTPLSIGTKSFKYNEDELINLLHDKLKQYSKAPL
ncbi:STM3941 family protein [Orbus mooreae]|uniref:STM3941 family protein n=1 Tax=Orbus mooreae TaxID=3074107 RepID=UPI00370D5C60